MNAREENVREGRKRGGAWRNALALLLVAGLALGSLPSPAPAAHPPGPMPPDLEHIRAGGGSGVILPAQPYPPGTIRPYPGPPPVYPPRPYPRPYPPRPYPYPVPPAWWGNDNHHDQTGAVIAGLALGAIAVAAASSASSPPPPTPIPAPAPLPSDQTWQKIEVDGQVYYKMGNQFLKPYVENGQVVYRVVDNPIR